MIDENLTKNAEVRGQQLIEGLNNIKNEFPDKIKEVRGKGLLTAFEMHNEKKLDGHIISVNLLAQGIYAKETHHSIVRLAPALTITSKQIEILLCAINKVIKDI